MSNQYFENSNLEHEYKEFTFDLRGNSFKFTSDSGVFSRQTVDYGSRVLIDSIDFTEVPDGDILDVGCGYGPIGLALAKDQTDRKVVMSDVNLRAMELAQKNADDNQVNNIEIIESSVYDAITGSYAVVVSNPPIRAGKNIVSEIISGAKDHLLENGHLYIVIQKKQGAPSAKKLMKETYGNVEIVKKDKGYYILRSVR
ncbi:class I SAM-dependent methyltransferase [Companilactobacillus metriopterae]|uniref:class I SAM-dependent methyltransferase n=1 Tax=Companilactobacillus metriopterae TaxID=1909267 RepID=UPI00100A37B6|nr:class I SAM-dependent methyltransferase [Companilactobacillus metriopterae]